MIKNLPAVQETPVRFLGREDPLEKGWATHSSILGLPTPVFLGFPGISAGEESAYNPTWIRSLGREDPLEKGTATHCSILAWRIPWTV